MTTEQRINRFAEYWCYHKPRQQEMSDELKNEIQKIAKEAFAAGMAFQQDSMFQDFDGFWDTILQEEIKW